VGEGGGRALDKEVVDGKATMETGREEVAEVDREDGTVVAGGHMAGRPTEVNFSSVSFSKNPNEKLLWPTEGCLFPVGCLS
jgi:hypothetical protein